MTSRVCQTSLVGTVLNWKIRFVCSDGWTRFGCCQQAYDVYILFIFASRRSVVLQTLNCDVRRASRFWMRQLHFGPHGGCCKTLVGLACVYNVINARKTWFRDMNSCTGSRTKGEIILKITHQKNEKTSRKPVLTAIRTCWTRWWWFWVVSNFSSMEKYPSFSNLAKWSRNY